MTPRETTVTIVYPSIAATPAGRLVGRLAGMRPGLDRFALFGKLMALATIPLSLAAFAWKLLPFVACRYRVTDQRIVVEQGLGLREVRSIALNQFDAIELERQPGQQYLRAADLVFRRGQERVFRLDGVPHPEPFRMMCLRVQTAMQTVAAPA